MSNIPENPDNKANTQIAAGQGEAVDANVAKASAVAKQEGSGLEVVETKGGTMGVQEPLFADKIPVRGVTPRPLGPEGIGTRRNGNGSISTVPLM